MDLGELVNDYKKKEVIDVVKEYSKVKKEVYQKENKAEAE